MELKENFELKDVTTFHLSAKAKYYINYNTLSELKDILCNKKFSECNIFHIGGGSNLVFTNDYKGVLLHSSIQFINVIEDTDSYVILEVGSGVVWDDFVSYCVKNNYYGVENMSLIPGEVGASAVQNIGSYGAEVKDVIYKVHTLSRHDVSEVIFSNNECKYGYRDSIFKNEFKDKYIVTSVEYKLSKLPVFNLTYGPLKKLDTNSITLAAVRDEIIRVRTEKLPDPKVIGSVGSFFKNPIISMSQFNNLKYKFGDIPNYHVNDDMIKVPAAWLIEQAGMKGASVGDAQTYKNQCLVIVNNGNAKACDVVALFTSIIEKVKSKFGIELFPEANII